MKRKISRWTAVALAGLVTSLVLAAGSGAAIVGPPWCGTVIPDGVAALPDGTGASDPVGPPTGQGYVVRGGAFDSPPRHTRSAHRNWFYADTARPTLGFRLAAGAG